MIRKRFLFTILFALIIYISHSQSLTDVARSKQLIWYGVDFTYACFVGYDKSELNECKLNDWSYTSVSNTEAGFIKSSYGKKIFQIETSIAKSRNDTINCNFRFINHTFQIDMDIINQVVNDYKITGSGFGLLFLIESIEKVSSSIFIWVIYINNSSGKLISSRRYIGNVKSIRNLNSSKEGVKLVIKLSGNDLKRYK